MDLIFFSWFRCLSVAVCCLSSCETFDFTFCCGVRLVTIEILASANYEFNQWLGRQYCNLQMRRHEYTNHFDFIILFIDILSLCAINLGVEFVHIFIFYIFYNVEYVVVVEESEGVRTLFMTLNLTNFTFLSFELHIVDIRFTHDKFLWQNQTNVFRDCLVPQWKHDT